MKKDKSIKEFKRLLTKYNIQKELFADIHEEYYTLFFRNLTDNDMNRLITYLLNNPVKLPYSHTFPNIDIIKSIYYGEIQGEDKPQKECPHCNGNKSVTIQHVHTGRISSGLCVCNPSLGKKIPDRNFVIKSSYQDLINSGNWTLLREDDSIDYKKLGEKCGGPQANIIKKIMSTYNHV